MPFERALSIEEINQINRQLSAGTHIAVLLVDDSEYGYFEFGGAFDQLQALLCAYRGTSNKTFIWGRGISHRHQGIFIYQKFHYRRPPETEYNIEAWEDQAEIKIVAINTVLSRGIGGGGR